MKYAPIDPILFVESRERFCKLLKANSIAFFNSNDEMPRNGDAGFLFRQNSDLFYLSGIDQEQSILVLFPDAPLPKYREILFLKKTNEHIAVWEGHKYTKEEARATSGVQSVYWLEDYSSIVPMLMNHAKTVYFNLNENDRFSNEVPYKELRFANDMKSRYPAHAIERSAPLLASLRAITESDIVLFMVDSTLGITHQDRRLCDIALEKGKSVIICLNKIDLLRDVFADQKKKKEWIQNLRDDDPWLNFCQLVTISAQKNRNINYLREAMKRTIVIRNRKIPTGALNRCFLQLTDSNPVIVKRTNGIRFKVKYASMLKSSPPTFLLFSNKSQA